MASGRNTEMKKGGTDPSNGGKWDKTDYAGKNPDKSMGPIGGSLGRKEKFEITGYGGSKGGKK